MLYIYESTILISRPSSDVSYAMPILRLLWTILSTWVCVDADYIEYHVPEFSTRSLAVNSAHLNLRRKLVWNIMRQIFTDVRSAATAVVLLSLIWRAINLDRGSKRRGIQNLMPTPSIVPSKKSGHSRGLCEPTENRDWKMKIPLWTIWSRGGVMSTS